MKIEILKLAEISQERLDEIRHRLIQDIIIKAQVPEESLKSLCLRELIDMDREVKNGRKDH